MAPSPTPKVPRVTPRPSLPASPALAHDPSLLGGFRPPLLPAYREAEPPPGYELRIKWNAPLLAGGGIVLGATYIMSMIYGAGKNFENGLGSLAVPIFGPWMALGARDFSCNVNTDGTVSEIEDSQKKAEACIANQTATAGILVGLGVGQLVGTSLLTVGILDREKQWIRSDLLGIQARLDVALSPGWTGVTASGEF